MNTGAVIPQERLLELNKICADHNVWLVSGVHVLSLFLYVSLSLFLHALSRSLSLSLFLALSLSRSLTLSLSLSRARARASARALSLFLSLSLSRSLSLARSLASPPPYTTHARTNTHTHTHTHMLVTHTDETYEYFTFDDAVHTSPNAPEGVINIFRFFLLCWLILFCAIYVYVLCTEYMRCTRRRMRRKALSTSLDMYIYRSMYRCL